MNMFKLINIQLKVNFGLSAMNWYRQKGKKKFWGGLGIIFVVILGIAPLFYLYLNALQMMYEVAVPLGQTQVVLTSGLVASSILVLFMGIFYVMSAFYFSRDLSFLIPLPILPRDILAAKFSVVMINNYLTILPFLGPALWIYGVNQRLGPLYWLLGVLVFLLVPVIPLTLASSFILFLMRVTNLGSKKDLLRVLGMFVFIFIILIFNYMVNRIPEGQEMEYIQQLFSDPQGLVNQTGRIFPPAIWATLALSAGGSQALLNLLAFIGVSILGIIIMLFLGDRLFYRGLIGGDEVQGRKEISASALEKKISRVGSPIMAIAWREIKILFRTPIYMFNSVAMLFILPVIMLIPAFSGGYFEEYLEMIRTLDIRLYLNLAAAAFIGTMALFAPASSSSFSREGRLFWISQVIPMDPLEQIKGKVVYSLMIALLAAPIIIFASIAFIQWSILELFVIIGLGLALSLPAITISLLIDLLRPYLDWDNPQKAIKQNMNVVLSMVAGAAIYLGIYQVVYLSLKAGVPDYGIYLIVLVVSLILGVVPYGIMAKIATTRYRDISV
ncbi:putative ABC transporter permease subunit [Candidatus Contubernalis alkaliaceticus]|uniref:putative ABC transporter permease subunit n=1 Tax=Candidatus Contubernalis alkaliaceticus TaxID=338645 RepID=UPI001F4C264D|nr:hypothetical protein [Candidatus Contubernalis alkalaceticus]UNC91406.1 hypothetical protein HUE98_04460 [Candidatus Contubernalis alkalaceticus]